MTRHLFVYGTLRPGEVRWPFLEPYVIDDGADDTARGLLYDTGNGYPAARFDADGTISGRVYELRPERLDEALSLLDEVEAAVLDLFRRVEVTTGSGTIAWAYEYSGDEAFEPISSGNWLAHR
jgi:gamma-glutamylcyclotransferase (GGCT)/AIG2-like uncharacterized protein YtfP